MHIMAPTEIMVMNLYRFKLILFEGLNNDRRSVNDGLAYMTNIDQLDIGFEFPPYEDPPPPYSPPKPIDDIPMEAPPPYELTSSQMETEPTEIIHTETNALEVRSGAGEVGDEHPVAVSAATAVMLLGNTRWMDNHSLRPMSALEPFQSELIELTQPNLDSRFAMTLSSPVLTSKKRNQKDSRCQSHGFTNSSRSGELFNAVQRSTDSSTPAPSQKAVNHSASNHSALKHLAFRQMKFDSSTPQVMLKMHNKLAHSSLLKHAVEATASSSNISRPDKMYRESPRDQHLFFQTNFFEASPSSERSTKNPNGFETLCDPGDPLNIVPAESEVEDDPSLTQVKHFSSSNWGSLLAEHRNSLMQKSAPEVSLYLKSSQVLCADPRKEKKPLNIMKIKDKSKSKPSLCNGSFLKKQKQKCPSRPQSCSGPDLGPNTNRSSLAHNLTGELCNASSTLKKKTTTEEPSSCFAHLVPDDDGSSCIHDSNAAKTQLYIGESTTTLDNGNSLQPLASNDQSDFNMETRCEGLAAKPVLQNTLMSVCSQSSQSPVGLPSPAQGLLSPDLPIYQQFLRSESITSQASFYSICSETGEKKHTKSVLPKVSKGLTVQGTMSTGSGYLSPEDTSRITDLKEDAVHIEKMDVSSTGMEITGEDNCIVKDSLRNTTSSTISTLMATSSLPVQGSQNYSLSDWKVKEDHSTTNRYDPATNKMKNEKSNSNNLQVTLVDALSFSSSKCIKELPLENILECDQLTGTMLYKTRSDAHNVAGSKGKVMSPTNTELYSNAGETELSYQSCKVPVKPAHDDKGRLMFKDQLRQGVKDLVPGHKKHSCNRCKERLNTGKKHKSKHMESFEYLVSRILQQLEASHFDDCTTTRHSTVQKVQRPRHFGHKSDCYSAEISLGLSSKSVAKQSRPVSLPNTKNNSFKEGSINAELATLDFTNRNSCMLESVENDNDGPCQQLHHGEYEAESRTVGYHSSGTPVSVAL